jgi:hypothetical protein
MMVQDLANIPGFQNVYNDYNLKAASTPATNTSISSVLLIGTALDGPVGPYQVQRIQDVDTIFGSMVDSNNLPNGMSLVRGTHENYGAGCTNFYLMRIGGEIASASLVGTVIDQTIVDSMQESVGTIAPNTQSVIVLPVPLGGTLVTSSVIVNVGGQTVTSGFSIDGVANTVTLQAGYFSPGAAVYVTFQFTTVVNTTTVTDETAIQDSSTIFYIQHSNAEPATLVVEADGEAVNASAYTFTAASNKIIFNSAPETPVTSSYVYDNVAASSTFVNGTVTGNTNIFSLAQVPISDGSMVVMVNNSAISANSYTVIAADQKLFVNSGVGQMTNPVVAEYDYNAANNVTPQLTASGIYAGSLYNGVTMALSYVGAVGTLTITAPASKGGTVITVNMNNYAVMKQVVDAVNSNTSNNFCKLSTNVPAMTPNVLNAGSVQLTGGTDGPSYYDANYTTEMYSLLADTYTQLINWHSDFVVPLDVYDGDPAPGNNDFVQQLAQFCAVSSMVNRYTHGVISVMPMDSVNSLADIANFVTGLSVPNVNVYWLQDNNGNDMYDNNGNLIDIGRFISVVVGPEVIVQNTQLGLYAAPAAALYAGLISTLPANQGPVGQQIPNTYGLRYNFSSPQVSQLLGLQYVVLYSPASQQAPAPVVVADGLTAANPNSDYRRLTTVRVVAGVLDVIQNACQPFLGLPNSPQNQGAMTTAISAQFKSLISAGVLLAGSTFNIYAGMQNILLSQAIIDVDLYIPLELAHIQTTINLKPAS